MSLPLQSLATGETMCTCSFGTGPGKITPIPLGKPVTQGSIPLAQIQDYAVPPSTPFIMCTSMGNPAVAAATAAALGVLTPQPCTPVPTGPWTSPATATILIYNQPSLLSSGATRMCAYGGTITTIG